MPTDIGRTSDGVADAWLDYLWRGVALTVMPATTYWGLSTTQPGTDGSNITEPTDADYALVAVARNSTNFAAATARAISTAADVTFPAATSGGSGYGLVGWIPVWSDASRTTFLGFWVITGGPQLVNAGVAPNFPAGSLTWTSAGN